jgi:hypothetical protein
VINSFEVFTLLELEHFCKPVLHSKTIAIDRALENVIRFFDRVVGRTAQPFSLSVFPETPPID